MPQYSYSCHHCGTLQEIESSHDAPRPKWKRCLSCGSRALRDIGADHVAAPPTRGKGRYPILSTALALPSTDQIPDAVQKFKHLKGVNVEYDNQARLIVKSADHQRQVLAALDTKDGPMVNFDSFY